MQHFLLPVQLLLLLLPLNLPLVRAVTICSPSSWSYPASPTYRTSA